MFEVIYAIDHLDPTPTTETFETEGDAVDWLTDAVEQRVAFQVEHSPYELTESDLAGLYEIEYSLARITNKEG